MTIQELFWYGMKREIEELIPVGPRILELGTSAGAKFTFPGAATLDDWFAPAPIPLQDESMDTVVAFHFLEHLSGHDAILTLRAIERVLCPGGTALIVVPHFRAEMQAQDLTHKSQWCLDTWPTLFNNKYYDPAGQWQLRVHANFLMGVAERNLAIFTQLVKER